MDMSEKTQPGIIYFHGYGSSPNTDKVKVLREHFREVYAFPIDVDPSISIPYLENEIGKIFAGTINVPSELVFVGTSLGAWYAGLLAEQYHSPAVLINPCYTFRAVKTELGIAEEIKDKYEWLGFHYPTRSKFFIDPQDEVIDMLPLISRLETAKINYFPELVPGATHRFNGEPFEKVIEFIKSENF